MYDLRVLSPPNQINPSLNENDSKNKSNYLSSEMKKRKIKDFANSKNNEKTKMCLEITQKEVVNLNF